MRVSLVAPPWLSVPPTGYGGTEWVVHLLAEHLVTLGHEVTLYATSDSVTSAELVSFLPRSPSERMHDAGIDATHAGQVIKHIRERAAQGRGADVVHDHTARLGMAFAHTMPMPVVYTHHNPITDDRQRLFAAFFDDVTHVCLSANQRSTWSRLTNAIVVPNAIDVAAYDADGPHEDFLLCLSRIHPDKGNHFALEAARRVGRDLVLVGKIDPGEGDVYFAEMIEPFVDGHAVRYLGEVSDADKRDLLQRAAATLFPICWDEPFGLVMAESMAAGTPCIAFARGAAPEVIEDGVTGFLVAGVDEMVAALDRLGEITAGACRAHVDKHFAPAVMTRRYVDVYEAALMSAGEDTEKSVELPTGRRT